MERISLKRNLYVRLNIVVLAEWMLKPMARLSSSTSSSMDRISSDNALWPRLLPSSWCYCNISLPLTQMEGSMLTLITQTLVNKTADVTRSMVQKAVVILATQPVLGSVRSKLGLVTQAFFAQKDFSKLEILEVLPYVLIDCQICSLELGETDSVSKLDEFHQSIPVRSHPLHGHESTGNNSQI